MSNSLAYFYEELSKLQVQLAEHQAELEKITRQIEETDELRKTDRENRRTHDRTLDRLERALDRRKGFINKAEADISRKRRQIERQGGDPDAAPTEYEDLITPDFQDDDEGTSSESQSSAGSGFRTRRGVDRPSNTAGTIAPEDSTRQTLLDKKAEEAVYKLGAKVPDTPEKAAKEMMGVPDELLNTLTLQEIALARCYLVTQLGLSDAIESNKELARRIRSACQDNAPTPEVAQRWRNQHRLRLLVDDLQNEAHSKLTLEDIELLAHAYTILCERATLSVSDDKLMTLLGEAFDAVSARFEKINKMCSSARDVMNN